MKPLPYRFPDERSVILRDAQRVQALPLAERLQALLSFLAEGGQLAAASPNREAAFQLRVQERTERRRQLREFLRNVTSKVSDRCCTNADCGNHES